MLLAEVHEGKSYALYESLSIYSVSIDITTRTRIRNNFPKDRSKENKKKYSKTQSLSLTSKKT